MVIKHHSATLHVCFSGSSESWEGVSHCVGVQKLEEGEQVEGTELGTQPTAAGEAGVALAP